MTSDDAAAGGRAAPEISIVIPIFNRANTIARAIESCLAQTADDFEILLVDDRSTDDLDAALEPFLHDPRIRLVRHEVNQGVSAARNTGVHEAKGALIAFLDSDDAWYPTKLEKQLSAVAGLKARRFLCGTLTEVVSDQAATKITPTRRPSPDVPLGDYMFVRKVRERLPMVADSRAERADGYFMHVSSILLPRRLALATPFPASLNQYEDLAFFIELDRQDIEVVLIEESLAVQHDDRRPGRLGHRDDVERGHRFIEFLGDALSSDARLAFETSHLAHLYAKERPIHTIKIVLRAFTSGLIGLRSVIGILFRTLFGQTSHRSIRDRVNRLRFRRQVLPERS